MSRSSSRSSLSNELFNFPRSSSNNIPVTGSSITNNDLASSYPFPQSLLSARRPSWTPSLSFRDVPENGGSTLEDTGKASSPSSPEDGGNFRRSLQIDNKGLVGDAVGNMSISPFNRDVVLAARRGLFIIDLESPLDVPRFLPQGGTWDVADVQWNPHHSRAEFIVSTSSEKLLIWNLYIVGKTSIEHILHSHYRAITDINWHTTEPDTVVSTGIDSWLWSWDLRTPEKPVFGLCAFNAGGTQVKWNRQDGNILASSHLNEILIWDRRKGSLPVSRIRAHNSKIYGIDWSHERRNEIVTCSLDKTIKVWDVGTSPTENCEGHVPKTIIETHYPVWRARDLPFGKGVLSLPQRGETALEMFAYGDGGIQQSPVEVFEGHTDAVKEFVWRKGGRNGNEYQLITWSKDKTLRFWPVDSEVMQKVGYAPEEARSRPRLSNGADLNLSFRVPPEGNTSQPTISAPVGHRGILAEVRAPLPPQLPNPVLYPHHGSAARARSHEGSMAPPPQSQSVKALAIPGSARQGGTMSRGNIAGKSAKIEMITWMKNVKEVPRKEGSSGPGSGADSTNGSRFSSRSRTDSDGEREGFESGGRSESGNRAGDEQREKDNQSLQSEITSVIAKLEGPQSKIRLEKHEPTKKHTYITLGLNGPWGRSSSVFIRVSFTFPRDYPQASHPNGTPSLELERSPLVSIRSRAFMLRRLKAIRENRRPCLEPCLRFLLFGSEDEKGLGRVPLDSDSSDEEGKPPTRKSREFMVTLLRSHKNMAEPRTSQGVFGPNGDLICFFRAPLRIVHNPLRDISVSSDVASHSRESVPRLFQSPALLSDAVRRLGLAATDRSVAALDLRKADDGPDNILRIMTNLLTFSQQKYRRESEPKPLDGIPGKYSLVPNRRNTVYIRSVDVAKADKRVAREYVFESKSLSTLCKENAQIASANMRYDHARIFMVLQSLFPSSGKGDTATMSSGFGLLAHQIVTRLYAECSLKKDIQMLAMASIILLQACRTSSARGEKSIEIKDDFQTSLTSTSQFLGGDYFSLSRRKDTNRALPVMSQNWPRLPISPTTPAAAAISSSNSSRGSWSTLFNTGSVRQFMSGVQDSLKDGLSTPSNDHMTHGAPIPVPGSKRIHSTATSPLHGKDSSIHSTGSMPRSWGDNQVSNSSSAKAAIAFSSAGHVRRSTFSQITNSRITIPEKKILVFDEVAEESNHEGVFFEPQLMKQFVGHILVYADMLFRWQLFHKRVELLKSVNQEVQKIASPHVSSGLGLAGLGVVATCERCGMVLGSNDRACLNCTNRFKMPQCSICRLPVKGLSRTCSGCLHVTHFNCWRNTKIQFCPTGCGCMCLGFEMDSAQQEFTRLVQSPHSAISVLPPSRT